MVIRGSNKSKMGNTPTISWGFKISGPKILGKQILAPEVLLYSNSLLRILV